jgi:protein-tyrosine phosphatase
MDVVLLNEHGSLYLSSDIDDWPAIRELSITAVIDLDGDLDIGVPNVPNQLLYVYFPIDDDGLPDLVKLDAVARLGAGLVSSGQKVLCHCLLGFNRSALMTGLILVHLGMSGSEAVELLQSKRPGALFNEAFADYLRSL